MVLISAGACRRRKAVNLSKSRDKLSPKLPIQTVKCPDRSANALQRPGRHDLCGVFPVDLELHRDLLPTRLTRSHVRRPHARVTAAETRRGAVTRRTQDKP